MTYMIRPFNLGTSKKYNSYIEAMTLPSGHRLPILSTSYKFQLSTDSSYVTAGIYLAPHKMSGLSKSLCPWAKSCYKSCIYETGRMPTHHDSYVRKTHALAIDSSLFIESLVMEIKVLAFQCSLLGKSLWMRLDGTSDLLWDRHVDLERLVNDTEGLEGFYGYTKGPLAIRKPTSFNRFCYSLQEGDDSMKEARKWLQAGHSVAVVVSAKDYKKYKDDDRFIDGDKNDHRFLDSNKVVLLKAKRLWKGKKYDSGIVTSMDRVFEVMNG